MKAAKTYTKYTAADRRAARYMAKVAKGVARSKTAKARGWVK